MSFADRASAGRQLAAALDQLEDEEVVVLGLPRGGVVVAAEVARLLQAPLDIIMVHKIGAPFQRELAVGTVGEGGVFALNPEVSRAVGLSPEELEEAVRRERLPLERRAATLRGGEPPLSLSGKTAVVVDDGVATGSTARAACQVARAAGAKRVVLAVPVAPPDSLAKLAEVADEVVCLEAPESFFAVGLHYKDFSQVSDETVTSLIASSRRLAQSGVPDPDRVEEREVVVEHGALSLPGRLGLPGRPRGVVLFAHGSGSSRLSPRNAFLAERLNQAGFATLLFDLLTEQESVDRRLVFDVELLGGRLVAATQWVAAEQGAARLPVGYFGASTGAAAALWAAAELGARVSAVVSRGGRPDLAAERLGEVRAPTLFVVGGADELVLELNEQARRLLAGPSELAVVPGATHLFEEEGALEEVSLLAGRWFSRHLGATSAGSAQ